MDKVKAWVLVLLLVWFSMDMSNGSNEKEQEGKKESWWEWQTLRNAYSVYTALFPSNIAHSCWSMLKDLFHHTHVRLFPPNIDFRRGEEGEEVTAGDVVTDALARSVGTTKATVEDTAKSAAQTVHNVVKKTTSSRHDTQTKKSQNEL